MDLIQPQAAGGGGGGLASWQRMVLSTADATLDANSIVTSATDDGTKSIVSIDRNKASAYIYPSVAATWLWDTGLTAEQWWNCQFIMETYNSATLASSNIVFYMGLTSDPVNPSARHMGSGINYQLAGQRPTWVRNTANTVGFQNPNGRGVLSSLHRCGASIAGTGNIAAHAVAQDLTSGFVPTNSWYSVSPTEVTAVSGTDPIYFYVCIGFVATALTNVNVEVAFWRSAMIAR